MIRLPLMPAYLFGWCLGLVIDVTANAAYGALRWRRRVNR